MKRDLVAKGVSADEIERIIKATAGEPVPKYAQPAETRRPTGAGADRARLVALLCEHGMQAVDVERLLRAVGDFADDELTAKVAAIASMLENGMHAADIEGGARGPSSVRRPRPTSRRPRGERRSASKILRELPELHDRAGKKMTRALTARPQGDSAIDLFQRTHEANLPKAQPLAARMRPRSLDEFVGQEHFLGPGKLSAATAAGRSARLGDLLRPARQRQDGPGPRHRQSHPVPYFARSTPWPPASRKCATCSTQPAPSWRPNGQRTILFVDELHRFNRAQQDVLLPDVEEGRDHPDRRDHAEPVLRHQLAAAEPQPDLHLSSP